MVSCKAAHSDENELALLLQRELLLCADEPPELIVAYNSGRADADLNVQTDARLKLLAPKALSHYSSREDSLYGMALTGMA